MRIATYPSDLTGSQWKLIAAMLAEVKRTRSVSYLLREILNAILYVVKGGRMLPRVFSARQTVY